MQAAPSKRRIEDVDDSEEAARPTASKRSRADWDPYGFGFDVHPSPPEPADTPDPTSVLPPPSDKVIQLRFQLSRFKGVYRVVRLPLSFTFAHLYRFILLIFGWSGHHLHEAEVVTHVERYSPNGPRKGEVKKHRSFRVPEEPDRHEDIRAWQEWLFKYGKNDRDPAMLVKPKGARRQHHPPLDMNDPWDVLFAELEVPVKKDAEVTLGDIWAWKSRHNLSEGRCSNMEIAILFHYDLGASWDVHITVEPDKDGRFMWKVDPPRNAPVITVAKGGAPVEDAHSDYGETEPKKKKISDLLFAPDVFAKYLEGEIGSTARKTELAVYNVEEERARRQALAQERQRQRLAREQAGVMDEEEDEEDEDDEDDDEDDWGEE
ncbi:hypothetical protein K466DRAFT_483426 [Polyporus arcularius HHB13444]|uniref:Plasmid pRiA4b Orf3-like domain-containing protein n=1 Tax=Polyporus arcularius HHB13444 TaxID=1314778 RepID=A0A5C3PRY9_9APHY|nr:hypothetical protein K466DRAFT_483426 [Polyporus arcularius HHB13444]